MITPKSLSSFLSEAKESEAAQQAKEMGLTSVGYGNWADQTGKTVARTVDGRLVMIDPKADPMARPAGGEEEMPPEEAPPEIPEPDPATVEVLAKSFSGGRWDSIGADRRRQLEDRARQFLISKAEQEAAAAAEMEAQAAAAVPPEPSPEEQEMAAQDAAVQQKNAELDLELKAQEVEKGKLEIQQQKDALKQSKAMDKLAKKAQAEKDPGSMAQRMANDAEYEDQLAKDGEEALMDVQTEPEAPAPKPAPAPSKALKKTTSKAKKEKKVEDDGTGGNLDALLASLKKNDTAGTKKSLAGFRNVAKENNQARIYATYVGDMVPFNRSDSADITKTPAWQEANKLISDNSYELEGDVLASEYDQIMESIEIQLNEELQGKGKKRAPTARALKAINARQELMAQFRENWGQVDPTQQNAMMQTINFANHFTDDIPKKKKKGLSSQTIMDIKANRPLIEDVYSDGNTENVRNNISRFRPFFEDIDDQTVDDFINILKELPGNPYSRFGSAGKRNGQYYEGYFLGFDENGEVIRGDLESPDQKEQRARSLVKIFLQQGGYDPLSGQPLRMKDMRLDHFLPVQGKGGAMDADREHLDNFIWINDDVNARKSAMDVPEFLDVIEKDYEKVQKIGTEMDELERLDKIGGYVPQQYKNFIETIFTGESVKGAIQGKQNARGGQTNNTLSYLNDGITPDFLRESFQNQENLSNSVVDMKLQVLEKWKNRQLEEGADPKATNKEYKKLATQINKTRPDAKISRYMMRQLGVSPTLDDKEYFTRNGVPYTPRGFDLSGGAASNGIYNASMMQLAQNMSEVDTPEEKRAVQQEFAQKMEKCKNQIHNAFMPGGANKAIRTKGGKLIKRHDNGPLTNGLPENPGTAYKDRGGQAYRMCLYKNGLVNDDEVRRVWETSPREMIELRQFIFADNNPFKQSELDDVYSDLIDE